MLMFGNTQFTESLTLRFDWLDLCAGRVNVYLDEEQKKGQDKQSGRTGPSQKRPAGCWCFIETGTTAATAGNGSLANWTLGAVQCMTP